MMFLFLLSIGLSYFDSLRSRLLTITGRRVAGNQNKIPCGESSFFVNIQFTHKFTGRAIMSLRGALFATRQSQKFAYTTITIRIKGNLLWTSIIMFTFLQVRAGFCI
jgi:hypothetical protein